MDFQNEAAKQAVGYIAERYHIAPEFLWPKYPDDAVFRHPDNRTWFALLLLDTPRCKLGLAGSGSVDILDVKCDPLLAGSLLDGTRFLPGYHMNKEHWITILLDGSVPDETLRSLIDLSYQMTQKKKQRPR